MKFLMLTVAFCLVTALIYAEDLITYSWGWPVVNQTVDYENLQFFNVQPLGLTISVPYNTEIFSPCSGTVKVSDDFSFDGLGGIQPEGQNFRGYCLIIECLNAGDEENYLAVLLHLRPGSEIYDSFEHQGLAPVGATVYKGQYVGRVNHYFVNEKDDWPRLGFNLIKGYFKPENLKDYIAGYYYPKWPKIDLNDWQNPLEFIKKNSMYATWFGDGSLVQTFQNDEIDLIIDGYAHNIYDEEIFKAYNFDHRQILKIKPENYGCLPKGEWQIEWAPCLELLKFEGTYYLLEKNCVTCLNCKISELASKEVAISWKFNPLLARDLTESEADDFFNHCEIQEMTYLRDGTVVALVKDQQLEKFFLAHHNGYLSEFADAAAFWFAGYDFDDLIIFDNEEDFNGAFKRYGASITSEMIFSCGQTFDLTNH